MKIYQIYYNEASKANLEPEYIPYENNNCSVFFENDVIRELINSEAHKDTNYFGVVSHKLREKTDGGFTFRHTRLNKLATFSPQAFEKAVLKTNADIFAYNKTTKHDVCKLADRFHPNFTKIMRLILGEIGTGYTGGHCRFPIYFNHFVARPSVWDEYTNTLLFPAMEVMESHEAIKKLVWQNSNYPSKLPENLQNEWGISYYPYHSFICERLMSIFLTKNTNIRANSW